MSWFPALCRPVLSRVVLSRQVLSRLILSAGALTLGSACQPEPPLLTVALARLESPGSLDGVSSFAFRAEYLNADGAVMKRVGPLTFSPTDVTAGNRLDLATTQPKQKVVVTLEGLGILDGSSTPTLLSRATSSPFQFTEAGPESVTLLLGRIEQFSLLSQTLEVSRIGHTVVPMGNGTFLVAGGASLDGIATNALEMLDNGDVSLAFGLAPIPSAQLKVARTSLLGGRFFGSPVAVQSQGSVFLAGGDSDTRMSLVRRTYLDGSGVEQSLLVPEIGLSLSSIHTYDSVERFDPDTGSITQLNSLPHPRSMSPTLDLSDGTILFCGGLEQLVPGDGALSLTSSCFRYASTDNGSWGAAGVLSNPVVLHQLTAMDDGYMLSSGGMTTANLLSQDDTGTLTVNVSATADLFGPDRTLRYSGLMKDARAAHSVTWLPRSYGQALVTGGYGRTVVDRAQYPRLLDSAEIFDRFTAESGVASRAFVRLSAHLNYPRAFHSSVALEDGRVLILGGIGTDPDLPLPAEIIDPQADEPVFELVPNATLPPLLMQAVVPLRDDQLAVVGGMSFSGDGPSAAEAQRVRVWVKP